MNQQAIDSIKADRDAAVRERDDARLNSATDLERLIQVEEIIVKQTERIAGLTAERDAYQRAADDMAEALREIEQWSSHTIAFANDYGSNGVRDFYRAIARAALKETK